MRKLLYFVLPVLAVISFRAPAATLSVGDAAPEIKVSKWIKGQPVANLEAPQTGVIEFWATWCPTCRESIPKLTALAHQYTNVTFIGLDIWERDTNREAAVSRVLQKMGDKMDYRVALDTDSNFMLQNWLKAAGQSEIPTAFLVETGTVVYISHSISALQTALSEIASGTFDLEKSKKRFGAENKVSAFYRKVMKGGDEAELQKEGKELEALDQELGGITPGEKFDLQELMQEARYDGATDAYYDALVAGKNPSELVRLEAAARALAPKDENFNDLKNRLIQKAADARKAKQSSANARSK